MYIMKSLNINWLTEGLIDSEYKKYILLAYLQWVKNSFLKQMLYPPLSDLVMHYNNLLTIKENKQLALNCFPKNISKIDMKKFKIEYETLFDKGDAYLQAIEEILVFSIPKIKEQLAEGKEIYDTIENKLEINPVGIIPLNAQEGYMFIRTGNQKMTAVFEYQVTIFETAEEKHRGIKTEYITSYPKSLTNTYENIKIDIIKNIKKLPNPATYAVECELSVPLKETLLPIAKRSLVRYISNVA